MTSGATESTSLEGVAAVATTAVAENSTASVRMLACVVRPELTEGPYFIDEELNRSDIRSDPSDGSVKEGLPLTLEFLVSKISNGGCEPMADAMIDVWHCDAAGVYSDVSDPGFNTKGQKFLRGYQVTDSDGIARFTTIYPGWYRGRTVHIHFKIRGTTDSGSAYEFASQLFFDDDLSDRVYAQQPYAAKGERTLRNNGDQIYAQSGESMTLNVGEGGDGLTSTFDIGLQV